jgi:predicted alpha/beta superfamily hydrolase
MEMHTLSIDEYTAAIIYTGNHMDCPVIYTHLSCDTVEAIARLLTGIDIVLIGLEGMDWDRDLTPWAAKRAFRGGNDFSGGADEYLNGLIKKIIPTVESTLQIVPSSRILLGYSLAGLFSLYALYRTELFSCAASVSGSLWYDGFLDFLKDKRPMQPPKRVYFSLGELECATKNPRLSTVEACTLEAEQILRALGVHTIFERNPGNHFADVPERIAKAIRWLCAEE